MHYSMHMCIGFGRNYSVATPCSSIKDGVPLFPVINLNLAHGRSQCCNVSLQLLAVRPATRLSLLELRCSPALLAQ
jgi:hypothetical protein